MKKPKIRLALQPLLIGAFIVMVLVASSSIVQAIVCLAGASTTWTDGSGGWFDCTNNWSNGCPDSSKCILINNGGEATVDSGHGTAHAFSLTLGDNQGASGSVVVDGGDLEIDPSPPYTCPGAIYVGNQGRGTLVIDNERTVHCRYLYIAAVENSTGARSNGTVTVEDGASLLVEPGECADATGGAQICIGCDADGNAGSTAVLNVKDATVEVDNLFRFGEVLLSGVKVGPSGTLTGNSVLTLTGTTGLCQTVDVLGTLAPSGALTVQGNLDLTVGSTNTSNTIFHVTPTAQDSVEVSSATGGGTATLGGRVTVIISGTFSLPASFTLLHADTGLSGTFAFESIFSPSCVDAAISYDLIGNNVKLDLTSCH